MNKRGQGLSTTAIILIVLGVIILVILILGFVMGWEKIMPWIKPANNVKEVAQSCYLACSQEAKYDYCSDKRKLVTKEITLEDVNCNFLAEIKTSYGIAKCPAIRCDIKPVNNVDEAKALCPGKEAGDVSGEYLDKDKLVKYECKEEDIPQEETPP